MPWPRLKRASRMLLWPLLMLSLTACGTISGNQYFCPPEIDYDNTGTVRPEKYAVDRACYKSMTEKQRACYAEAR